MQSNAHAVTPTAARDPVMAIITLLRKMCLLRNDVYGTDDG
jgi:hypothetical protein